MSALWAHHARSISAEAYAGVVERSVGALHSENKGESVSRRSEHDPTDGTAGVPREGPAKAGKLVRSRYLRNKQSCTDGPCRAC